MVQHLADKPEKVEVIVEETESAVRIDVLVDSSDVGKVIGSRGRYADALRDLFRAVYGKHRQAVLIYVREHPTEK